MIFSFRQATSEDANLLMDIDLKAFNEAWDSQQWSDASELGQIHIATFYGTPVAFIVFGSFGADDTESVVVVRKIAVKKPYRRRGISRKLLCIANDFAREIKAVEVHLIVPESMCRPGLPHDASEWLNKVQFKANVIIPDLFINCGYSEDGYLFISDVK